MKYKILIVFIMCCFQTVLQAQVPGFVGKKNVLEIYINPLHGGAGLINGYFQDYNSTNKYFTPSITFERVVSRRNSFSLSWTQNKFNFKEPFNYSQTYSYSNSVGTMNRVAFQYHRNLKQWGLSPLGFFLGVGVSRNFINGSAVYTEKKKIININENFKIWGCEFSLGNRFITKNNVSINWGLRSLFVPESFLEREPQATANKQYAYNMSELLVRDFIISFYIGAGYVF